MIGLLFKIISQGSLIVAHLVIWIITVFLLPVMVLYASYLHAQPSIPDPLAGQVIVRMPEMITIPVPEKSIRKGQIISQTDLTYKDIPKIQVNDLIAQDSLQLIGQEAQKLLSKEKPILLRNIGSITIIKRNDIVTMLYNKGSMQLKTNGRALEQGGAGDQIKVLNQKSKKIITGRITRGGDIDVTL